MLCFCLDSLAVPGVVVSSYGCKECYEEGWCNRGARDEGVCREGGKGVGY